MDYLDQTRWGGRAKRYLVFPRAVIRFIDPVSAEPVSVATDLVRDNWLLHFFDPTVAQMWASREPLDATVDEKTLRVRPDLRLKRTDGQLELHCVCRDAPAPASLRKLRTVAKATGHVVVIRTRGQIRSDVVLLQNLRRLRQLMTLHRGVGTELDTALLALAKEPTYRLTLRKAFASIDPQAIDARLGVLHRGGRIHIELKEKTYGDATVIRQA